MIRSRESDEFCYIVFSQSHEKLRALRDEKDKSRLARLVELSHRDLSHAHSFKVGKSICYCPLHVPLSGYPPSCASTLYIAPVCKVLCVLGGLLSLSTNPKSYIAKKN